MSLLTATFRSASLRLRPNLAASIRFSSSSIKQSTNLKEFKELIKDDKLTITDFFATWCGPCKAISPVLEKLNADYPDVQFLKVDVDEAQDIAQEYGITAMPTFVLFKGNKTIGKIVGANPRGLQQAIEEYK